MGIHENIQAIRDAQYGRQVRSAIADSMDELNEEYNSLGLGLNPRGTIYFSQIPSTSTANVRDMYSIKDAFITTVDFAMGPNVSVPKGATVYLLENRKWDILATQSVTGVKGSAETDFRTGNIELTPENIGLGNVQEDLLTKASITALESEVSARANAISTEINARETADSNLQTQIDQLVAPTGEAPSAAEIENARIGIDNTTYSTLGEAIRTQVGKIVNALGDITGVVDAFELNSQFPTYNLKKVIPAGTTIRIAFNNIDISSTYHQFSFKNASGTNLNTYIFKAEDGIDNIVLQEDAYKIGFALAQGQTGGTFTCFTYDCAYGDMYEKVDLIGEKHSENGVLADDTMYPNFTLKKVIPAGTVINFAFSNIDISGIYHQFSFKNASNANLNSYIFKDTSGEGSVVLDEDAYKVGFALAERTNNETFSVEYVTGLESEIERNFINKPYNEVVLPRNGEYPTLNLKKVIPAGTVITFTFDNFLTTGGWHQFSFKNASNANLNSYIFKTSRGTESIILKEDVYKVGFAITNRTGQETFGVEYTLGLTNDVERTEYEIGEIRNVCRPVIWDCDNGWDIDDCVAGRILAWGVRQGTIDLMGVVLSCNNGVNSVSAIDGLMSAEGIGKCKIGVYPSTAHSYNRGYHQILANYAKHYQSESDAISDITLYRKALAQLPDGVQADVIITGYTNSFSRFMQSSADEYSPLSGLELANSKIRRLWVMGGNFDTGNPELNFKTYPDDTAYILANFTGDIYVQGYEIGINIRAGVHLDQITDTDDLLWKCLYNWNVTESGGNGGCNAFDPMTVLAAVDNDDFITCLNYDKGVISFDTTTLKTSFTASMYGHHYVARTVLTNNEYVHRLDNLLNKYIFPSLSHSRYRLK